MNSLGIGRGSSGFFGILKESGGVFRDFWDPLGILGVL